MHSACVKIEVINKKWGCMAVELNKLTKYYGSKRNSHRVLSDINILIDDGEFVAIVGKSGSGKSTLLNMIGCLDRPSAGKVYVDDQDTSKLSDTKLSELRGRKVGFIFQSFNLQPDISVLDNIVLPGYFAHQKKRVLVKRANQLAKVLDISDRLHVKPNKLSGGETQRVAIARALINNPSVILADEPTGNLDSENSRTVVKLLKSINRQMGTAVVIVTHDEDIAREADRIIRIHDGVAEEGGVK